MSLYRCNTQSLAHRFITTSTFRIDLPGVFFLPRLFVYLFIIIYSFIHTFILLFIFWSSFLTARLFYPFPQRLHEQQHVWWIRKARGWLSSRAPTRATSA